MVTATTPIPTKTTPVVPLGDLLAEISTDALAAYRALVIDLATNKPADKTKIISTMAAAGRTPEQLQSDVARAQERRAALAAIEAKQQIQSKLAAISARQIAAEASYKAAEEKHRAALEEAYKPVAAIQTERQALAVERMTLGNPESILRRTADPALLARQTELQSRLQMLRQEIAGHERALTDCDRHARRLAAIDSQAARLKSSGRPLNESDPEFEHLPRSLHTSALAKMSPENLAATFSDARRGPQAAAASRPAVEAVLAQSRTKLAAVEIELAEVQQALLDPRQFALTGEAQAARASEFTL